jgi:hypothetical protein
VREAGQETRHAQGVANEDVGSAVSAQVEERVRKSIEKSLEAAHKAREEALKAHEEALEAHEEGRKAAAEPGKLEAPPLPPLPPEMRERIRRNVTGDLYRIGVGSGLILLFIPLFVLAVVSKVFIDRSRAARRTITA